MDPEAGKLSYSGIELKRRDNALILAQTQKEFLDALLIDNSYEDAMRSVRRNVRALVEGRVPIEQLTITKKYAKTDYKTKQIHVALNERIKERTPALAHALGSRIPYVVVQGKQELSERGEDPDYALAHGLKVDKDYYLERMMKKPMSRLIIPLVGDRAFGEFWNRARGGAADRFFSSTRPEYIPPLLGKRKAEPKKNNKGTKVRKIDSYFTKTSS